MTASTARRRCVLLITYLILLFVGELSIDSTHFLPPIAPATSNNSCVGHLEAAPFGPGTARLPLCNIGNYAYAVYLKIGTPGYGLWLEIDTGSADSWFMTSDCISPTCKLRKRFNIQSSSKTVGKLGDLFNLTYGHGVRVQGELITDRLCLAADNCVPDQVLGAVKATSQSSMYSDGVLGLGFGSLSRFRTKGRKQSLYSILSNFESRDDSRPESRRSRTVLGLRLNRHAFVGGEKDGGELTVGYVNRTVGSPVFRAPLVVDNGGYWMIRLSRMDFRYSCTESTGHCPAPQRVPLVTVAEIGSKAILDTGSTYILSSSQNLRLELNRWLQRGWVKAHGEHVITDCLQISSLPDLRFAFCSSSNCSHSSEWILSPEQYTFPYDPFDSCQRRVGVQFMAGLPFTVLGTTFLSNFYTTFNFGEKAVELVPLHFGSTETKEWSKSNVTKVNRARTVERIEPFEDILTCLATLILAILLTPFR